eukprot:4351349-Pyramimonas_sp.AAC.1
MRNVYGFVAQICEPERLWQSCCKECRIVTGLLPLAVADLRQEWNPIVTCTDASPTGHGVCQRDLDVESVRRTGR